MEVGLAEHFQRPNTLLLPRRPSEASTSHLVAECEQLDECLQTNGTLGVRVVNQTADCDSPRLLEDGASRS